MGIKNETPLNTSEDMSMVYNPRVGIVSMAIGYLNQNWALEMRLKIFLWKVL